MDSKRVHSHRELDVYRMGFESAMQIFEISKEFPVEERFSLTDQIRRSSRSVCSNITEAYRKRKYPKAFVSKLSDAEGEAAETQTWLDFALSCGYINRKSFEDLNTGYDQIIGKLVNLARFPEKWKV
jgi:four helix bundle protein